LQVQHLARATGAEFDEAVEGELVRDVQDAPDTSRSELEMSECHFERVTMETTLDRFGRGEKPGAWIDSPGPFPAEESAFEAAVARIIELERQRTAGSPA
jgi:hypothetical protein